MKRLLIILSLFLVSFICIAQSQQIKSKSNHTYNFENKELFYVPSPDTIPLVNVNIDQTPEQNGWTLDGTACYGCASYFYKILRSKDPYKSETGYFYYFYFYFYSNSYSEEGILTTTSLKDINFYADDKLAFSVPYILIEPNQIIYGAWMRSTNSQTRVSYQASNITVY